MEHEGVASGQQPASNLRLEALPLEAFPLLVGVAPGGPDADERAREVLQPDGRANRAEDLRRPGDDPLEHLVEALRTDELAAEVEQRLRRLGDLPRLLRLAPLRLVQPRVLERDGRVPGE